MDQSTRIHVQQDKNNAFFGVGDVVHVTANNGDTFEGEITCIDLKKEGDQLHTCIDLKNLGAEILSTETQASFWVENIATLKIIRFKGEK